MCYLNVSTDAEYLPHLVNEWPLLHLKFVSMYDEDLQKKNKKKHKVNQSTR